MIAGADYIQASHHILNTKINNTGLHLYVTDAVVEVDCVDVGSDASTAGLEAFQII